MLNSSLRQMSHGAISFVFCIAIAACGSSGGSGDDVSTGGPGDAAASPAEIGNQLRSQSASRCSLDNDDRQVGDGIDAPGRLAVASPPVGNPPGACNSNTGYRFGTGIFDITGVIADTASPAWVNPQQVFNSLHTRVYARAFAIESPCNNKRIMFVSLDTGLMSNAIRQAVLASIAADPALSGEYDARNVMLSVTHTHSDPNTGLAGDNGGLAVIANGTFAAIKNAAANLAAHPETGVIQFASGELLNTNINRSKPAFANNPQAERQAFLNARGEEVQVNKRVVQLELYRNDGSVPGVINWFGVHPTVIGPTQSFVSGDVKGTASLGFEKLMGTDYSADPATGTFIAAFAQADEGDASPNIFIEQFPHPDPRRGGGEDDLDSNAISALKQFARSLDLFGTGEAVTGPVDFRLFSIPIANITVDDPVVLASLNHPTELDEPVKKTCSGILGASFGAGAEDGPGPTQEGLTCDDNPDVLAAAAADFTAASNGRLEGFPGGFPRDSIPGAILSTALFCNASAVPSPLGDFSCQAEKPILLPRGDDAVTLQLFRIGQVAVLGVPWEVTTIAARRIKTLMLQELAPVGVDTIVIAGLVNNYAHYLTTREEYATQQYEGASTLYGPWTHAAVSQEALKMARAMRNGTALDEAPAAGQPTNLSVNDGPVEAPNPAGNPGSVITQPPSQVQPGDEISTEFVAGHPRNNLRLQESYAYIERQLATGEWEVVVEDRDPGLIYFWNARIQPPVAAESPISSDGTGEARWRVPRNTQPGTYRVRTVGSSRTSGQLSAYEGISDSFAIDGPVAECP